MAHRSRIRALFASLLAIAFVTVVPTSGASAQEAPPVAWAVNGFGTTAAETAAATSTYEIVVDGVRQPEPVTVGPGGRVEIPTVAAGGTYDISFRNTANGETTGSVSIAPTATDSVDVAIHPAADGTPTVTRFVNATKVPADGSALVLRHVAATDATEFQLYTGGGETATPLEPVGTPVTLTNGDVVRYDTTLAPTVTYTLEARLASGTTVRTTFVGGGETPGNRVVYLSGLNSIDGATTGESGPFITPVLATSGGEGVNAGLYVINGFSESANETANSFTVLLDGIVLGTEAGLVVDPGERIAVPQATRGSTFTVAFRNGADTFVAGDVTVPLSGTVDVAVFADSTATTSTAIFDNNAITAPSSGGEVQMRNISAADGVEMEIVRGGNESGGGTTVGTPVVVDSGAATDYGTRLESGAILYAPRVTIDATAYRGQAFIIGSETAYSEARAVYAIGSELPPTGETVPVRSYLVATGQTSQPLAVVNGFGIGATETANTFALVVNGLTVPEGQVGPKTRLTVPLELERGTTTDVRFVDPVTGATELTTTVDIPMTGTVDLVVSPDADGNPTATTFTNGEPPASGTTLIARHAAGIGAVDVTLLSGGGETGTPLTTIAGPVELAPGTSVELVDGLSSAGVYRLEVDLPDGSILSTPFEPAAEGGAALQAAYLVGLGSGGTQTNPALRSFVVPGGSGIDAVTPVGPQRFVDTRPNFSTVDGLELGAGPIPTNSSRSFSIAGRGDVPADATGVVANFTIAGGVEPGFITPYPCGEVPDSSLVNWHTAGADANSTLLPLSPDGDICVYASAQVDVIIDIQGYVTAQSPVELLAPRRLVDTRADFSTVDGLEQGEGQIAAGSTATFDLTGRAGVPANATAVIANFTVVSGLEPGFITPYPCAEPLAEPPNSSLVNWDTPDPDANATIMPVSETGTLCVFASESVDLVIDVQGYLVGETAIETMSPVRLVETREEFTTVDGLEQHGGKIGAGNTRVFDIAGRADIPASATAVVANFTTVSGLEPGHITPFPCLGRSDSSMLNWDDPAPNANATVIPLSSTGQLCVFALTPVDLVIDVSGYVAPTGG